MKKILCAILLLGAAPAARAQPFSGLWQQAPANYPAIHGQPALVPERFTAFTVSEAGLRDFLATAPKDAAAGRIIDLPTPEGGHRGFRVWATPAMEPGLAKKYPGMATYTAEAVDNSRVTAKLDYTPSGFHGMVYDDGKTYLIDPYSGAADGAYIVYYKNDYARSSANRMGCGVGDGEPDMPGRIDLTGNGLPAMERLHGSVRRSYRLALAADSEYCAAVAGTLATKAAVLARMVTSVNRINGVYERELAVTMVLVANNDTLIFLGADPYTNSSGGAMLGQNQTTVDARIGNGNYDIGHVFSTGGGGVAIRGSVCQPGFKARGVTGSPSPVGDPFDIDFVAHEIGHQFGAGHTFNASTGSCGGGNGVAGSAYEPGSGSTIMAYAGICGGGNDFKANSDPYFHSASLEEISTFLNLASGGSACASTTASTNTNAGVPAFAATYAIPLLTPFELTAPAATDATAESITYCWEQRDLGDFGKSLSQTRFAGPLFRSFPPDTSRTRIFPTLQRLLFGTTSYNAEKLPDTARTLHFKLTERDIFQGWGTFNIPDDVITLNVIQTPAPFTVTYPAGGESLLGGDRMALTWNVSGTNTAPVSCASVDIFLSVDGGNTFPYVLSTGTPNDGNETIVLPNVPSTFGARIKVKGSGNVFFNISREFGIERSTVGVQPSALAGLVLISPVPAHDVLQIDVPMSLGAVQMRVTNTLGQLVWSGDVSGRKSLPVADWARGMYQVQLSHPGEIRHTRKIVLQ